MRTFTRRPFRARVPARPGLARLERRGQQSRDFGVLPAVAWALAASAASALCTGVGLAAAGRTPSHALRPAHIYWSNPETSRGSGGPGINAIGRADRDGTAVQKSFIANPPIPGEIAVGAGHVYWIEAETGAIARANLDGSHIRRNFILAGGLADALAVGGGHIYWTVSSGESGSAKIARANLDGSHIKRNFVSIGGGTYIGGLALNRRFVYWTNRDKGTVGRADLNGRHVTRRLIIGAHNPTGLALDLHHLYWANDISGGPNTGTVARADLRGSHVNETFISGADGPFGVAVDSRYIYWANNSGGTIGRARLGGSEVNQGFIIARVKALNGGGMVIGEGAPMGLAVGP